MEAIREFSGVNRFLSNFYPAKIIWMGYEVLSSEHAFQMAKLPLDASKEEIEAIALAASPGASKRAGRRCRLRADWEEYKFIAMREILEQKFSIPELREKLLATGDAELIEGNTWGDRIWGVDLRTGFGENHLGKTLMSIRESLRAS